MSYKNRVTSKELNLIKGAFRRVFSRSELRRSAINKIKIKHEDPTRKRVKNWGQCPLCNKIDAISNFDVDHINPVIPLDRTMNDMSLEELADRVFCDESNLLAICQTCHHRKSSCEMKIRRANKKAKKDCKKA